MDWIHPSTNLLRLLEGYQQGPTSLDRELKAFCQENVDYDVILAADCIGSYDQEHHDVSVRYLTGGTAGLCNNAEIGQLLSPRQRASDR